MATEKVKINYAFTDDMEREDTVLISVSGTGIDLKNPDHVRFMEALLKVVASQLYGKAHNIPIGNIKI